MIYTAVTIGPIFKTIGKARSVKAFWTASYMFSWIMKRLIEELGGCSILSPHLPEEEPSFDTIKTEVGLFPDRLFIEGDARALIESAKEKIIKELTKKGIDDIQGYISISTISVDVPDAEEGPLKILNEYLDTQELFCKSSPQGKDYMEEFMENAKNGFLQGFNGKDERPFESTSEIAVSGWLSPDMIKKNLSDKGEIDYTKLTKKDGYRNCYKYLAIIEADGDNFGKYIRKLSSSDDMRNFAKSFFNFSVDVANKLRNETKAVPVYIGGDDLKLFAPILGGDVEEDIFRIIEIIDECFQKFRTNLNADNQLSMSYGVSIFYHKSPMSEAMDVAIGTLKKVKKTETKDTVAISIRKHSGKKIEFQLPRKHSDATSDTRNPTLYARSVELIRAFKGDVSMINSLIYWIEEMYEAIFTDSVTGNRNRIKAVFANFFDEDVHKNHRGEGGFFERLEEFIYLMHEHEDAPQTQEGKKALLHGILRYCQFVTAKDEK